MCGELKAPCNACPWRVNSAPGWLGDSTPVEFLQQSESEIRMPCHLHVNYERADWSEQADKAPQCAGRAVHFANRCKSPQNPELVNLPADREAVFSNPQAFIDHHSQYSPTTPVITLVGPLVRVIGSKP